MIRTFICWGIFCALLMSCSGEPTITIDTLEGTYLSDPCPEIKIRNGEIVFDGETVSGRLISIKGENILATSRSIRFTETSEGCSLLAVPEPIYNFIKIDEGQISIQIFSNDRTKVRTWKQAAKELR